VSTTENQQDNLFPPSGHLVHPTYRADIDGLRGVAVLLVVVYHAFPKALKGGFLGVDIFFVISGFLISTIIFVSLERNSFSFANFYGRRIRRIFPALLLVLICCYAFGWLVLLADEYKELGKHIAAGGGFVSNIVLWNESGYFDVAAEEQPLLHLWSLGIEEQFYIAWPFILWAAWKKKANLLTISIIVAAISFGLNLAKYRVDRVGDFYSPLTRFWELLAGSLLAYVAHHGFQLWIRVGARIDACRVKLAGTPVARETTLRDACAIAGVLFIALGLMVISKERRFPGMWALLPVLGSVLIIAAGAESWFNKTLLSNRVLVWFGTISFPLYLWHWPLLSFAQIVEGEIPARPVRIAAVAAAIMLSWLTFRFVEHPVRFSARALETTLALLVMMVIVGVTGYRTFEQGGIATRSVVERNLDVYVHPKYDANLSSSCSIPNVSRYVACEDYVAENSSQTILLWGDSTAGAWLPVFLDVAKKRNMNVIRIEHQSCPPLLGVKKTRFDLLESRYYCDKETKQAIFDFIESVKPESIFVLCAWNSYSPYTNREFITDGEEGEADSATTRRAIEKQVPLTLKRLSEVGRVIVFRAWPFLPARPTYGINRIPFLGTPYTKKIVRAPYDDFKKDSELINSVFEKIDFPIELFDPAAKTCDADGCSSVYRNVELYSDGYHISTAGALQFRSEIEALIVAGS
jgi:peptidoglycan/LPS O-acetylase OafA/YrhL